MVGLSLHSSPTPIKKKKLISSCFFRGVYPVPCQGICTQLPSIAPFSLSLCLFLLPLKVLLAYCLSLFLLPLKVCGAFFSLPCVCLARSHIASLSFSRIPSPLYVMPSRLCNALFRLLPFFSRVSSSSLSHPFPYSLSGLHSLGVVRQLEKEKKKKDRTQKNPPIPPPPPYLPSFTQRPGPRKAGAQTPRSGQRWPAPPHGRHAGTHGLRWRPPPRPRQAPGR